MLVQLKLAGPSPPPPPAPPARWAEEGMAQLISTAPTFACKTVPYGNDIYDFGDYALSHRQKINIMVLHSRVIHFR